MLCRLFFIYTYFNTGAASTRLLFHEERDLLLIIICMNITKFPSAAKLDVASGSDKYIYLATTFSYSKSYLNERNGTFGVSATFLAFVSFTDDVQDKIYG